MTNLLDLPVECLQMVVERIPTQADLASACLTCHSLHSLAVPVLYNSIKILLVQLVLQPKVIRCLLNMENNGPQFIRHLELEMPAREDCSWDEAQPACDGEDNHKVHMVSELIHLILRRVHKDRLRSFRWSLPMSMNDNVVRELETRQRALEKVEINISFWRPVSGFIRNYMRLPAVSSLALDGVNCLEAMDMTWAWVSHNKRTLKALRLCLYESCVVEELQNARPDSWTTWNPWRHYLDISPDELPEMMEISSLSLQDLSVESMDQVVDFSIITKLTLLNCKDTEILFVLWTSMPDTIHLRKLCVSLHRARENDADAIYAVATSVNNFLLSFVGLEELYVSSTTHRRPIELKVLHKHRKTLQRLVVDHRSRTSGRCRHVKQENLGEIRRICRNLKELALSVDLEDESVLQALGVLSANIKYLRLCNPIPKACTNPKAKAQSIATTIAAACITGAKESEAGGMLKLIAIDREKTDDEMVMIVPPRTTELFYVERYVNILGEMCPVVTPILESKLAELGGPPVKIIKPKYLYQK